MRRSSLRFSLLAASTLLALAAACTGSDPAPGSNNTVVYLNDGGGSTPAPDAPVTPPVTPDDAGKPDADAAVVVPFPAFAAEQAFARENAGGALVGQDASGNVYVAYNVFVGTSSHIVVRSAAADPMASKSAILSLDDGYVLRGLAVSEDGNVYLAGKVTSSASADPHPFVMRLAPDEMTGGLVLKAIVDLLGAGSGRGSCDAIALEPGAVFVGCTFDDTISVMDAPTKTYGGTDLYFARLDPMTLGPKNAMRIGSAGDEEVRSLAVTKDRVVAAIRFGGQVMATNGFGFGVMSSPGTGLFQFKANTQIDWAIAFLDSAGDGEQQAELRAVTTFPTPEKEIGSERGSTTIVAAGDFQKTVAVPGNPKARGARDGIVFQFAPVEQGNGEVSFSGIKWDYAALSPIATGGPGLVHVTSVAHASNGDLVVAGDHDGPFTFDTHDELLPSNGQPQAFFARVLTPIDRRLAVDMRMASPDAGDASAAGTSFSTSVSAGPQLLWAGAFNAPMSDDATPAVTLEPENNNGRYNVFARAVPRP